MNPGIDVFSSPLLYLVRHGATVANDEDRFRGHLDYPLDDSGIEAAEEAANFLCYRPIGFMASSTLRRALQTAEIISPAIQVSFDRNPGLLPWNIGTYAGKARAKYRKELAYYVENKDEVPPEGESLSFFERRFADVLYRYLAQATYQQPGVLVTHSTGMTAAHVALDKEFADKGPGMIDIVEPGGIVAIYIGLDDKAKLVPLLGQVVADSSFS